ncbi:hypothetical protein Tco_0319353 [Tanacetum coccineum]
MATMAKNVLAAGKENEEMLLDSIHNGPFQFKEITILVTETTTAITRMQELSDLTPEEKSRLIMEYLVKLSKRHAFWSLNEDILKIMATNYQYAVSIKEDMAYPCLHSPKTTKEIRSIRRIQKRSIRRIEDIVCEATRRYQVTMDDPNITMEEYMRLEEEKANRRGKVYNWETAKYDKIWYDEDVHHLRSVETEFPAIVFDDAFTSKVSYFDDLDFFKDFENEFLAIVYNDALTSKSDSSTEPVVIPQRIDEFNLKDEASFFECDEKEQNILNFDNLFPFNVIYPNDSKSDKDNDDDKVDIKHSSGDLSVKPLLDVINSDDGAYVHGSNKLLETILGPREGKSTNVGGEFINLEILKCWSLETLSQSSCDFTTVIINGESEERRTTEGIIRNYYDREDGETTPRFEA